MAVMLYANLKVESFRRSFNGSVGVKTWTLLTKSPLVNRLFFLVREFFGLTTGKSLWRQIELLFHVLSLNFFFFTEIQTTTLRIIFLDREAFLSLK